MNENTSIKKTHFIGLLPKGLAIKALLLAGMTIVLSACSVHKLDIQQGNVLTQDMVEQLKVGMEQIKVRRIAGTPLIEDPFRDDRWDYVYRFLHGNSGELQYSYITLFFEDSKLKEIKVHAKPLNRNEVNTLHKDLRGNRS